MNHNRTSGVVGLVSLVLAIHMAAYPVCAVYCKTPTESTTVDRCLPFTQSQYIAAILGHDTIADSWYCSATCHDPWNSHGELSLRLEMERWMRANRTVGMFPEAYQSVRDEIMRLTNNLQGDTQHPESATHVRALSANATITDMPWLLVSNETLRKSHIFYHRYVRQRPIVRVLHLSEDTGEPEMIHAYLQQVSKWWAETERRVSQDPRAAVPFLPLITVDKFLGSPLFSPDPAMSRSLNGYNQGFNSVNGHNHTGRRQFLSPSRIPLPTALVYYYNEDCVACEVFGVAFDLLPLLYRRLCGYGHVSIVSCSPLVVFIRSGGVSYRLAVPALMLHGLQLPETPQVPVYLPVIFDVFALLARSDPFEGVVVPLGYKAQVVEVLVKILLCMVDWDMLEPRRLTPAEVSKYELEEKMAKQEEAESFTNASNKTGLNDTTVEGKNISHDDVRQKTANRTRRRRNVVTLGNELRRIVTFHVNELWGNSSDKMEGVDTLSLSMVHPQWFNTMSIVLTLLWFVLSIWKLWNGDS